MVFERTNFEWDPGRHLQHIQDLETEGAYRRPEITTIHKPVDPANRKIGDWIDSLTGKRHHAKRLPERRGPKIALG